MLAVSPASAVSAQQQQSTIATDRIKQPRNTPTMAPRNRRAEFAKGFLPKQLEKPLYSKDAPNYSPVAGETIPRRLAGLSSEFDFQDLQYEPEPGVRTTWDIVVRSATKFGDLDAVGSRKLLHTHEELKKVTKVVEGREVETEKKMDVL